MENQTPIGLPRKIEGVAQMPQDARKMGLDTTTGPGQLVYLASGFTSKKRSHRIMVWTFFICLLALPILFSFLAGLQGNGP